MCRLEASSNTYLALRIIITLPTGSGLNHLFKTCSALIQPGSAPTLGLDAISAQGFVLIFLAHICRKRCSSSRSKAHCSRSRSTETGSRCWRCCHGENRARTKVQPPSFNPHLRQVLSIPTLVGLRHRILYFFQNETFEINSVPLTGRSPPPLARQRC